MTDTNSQWFRRWFNEDYRVVYKHRDMEDSGREVAFVIWSLNPRKDAPILDLCCGTGRHIIPLFENGYCRLTGLDLSPTLLEAARKTLEDLKVSAGLVRGDMLHLPFLDGAFDYVLSFFSSFGYFGTDAANNSVLSEMVRVLRPGGRLWLDLMNLEHVVRNLEPETVRHSGGWDIKEIRRYVEAQKRIEKQVEICRGGESRSYFESVRAYDVEEIKTMLASVGTRIETTFGDYANIPHGPDSPRLIVVAVKG